MKGNRMFVWRNAMREWKIVKTWNPFVGCMHQCSYCWARRMARRLKCELCRAFVPHVHRERLFKHFKEGEAYFVSDMGDIAFCPYTFLNEILEVVEENPKTEFLFFTKDPSYYLYWQKYPENVILGVTIESDLWEVTSKYSLAPSPKERLEAIGRLRDRHLGLPIVLSIEPILKCNVQVFAYAIDRIIRPMVIWVGYDNYKNKLDEPTLEKTEELIRILAEKKYTILKKTMRKAWNEC